MWNKHGKEAINIIEELTPVMSAIIAAVIYAVGGYLKSGEKFDSEKMFVTLLIGACVGVVSYAIGDGYDIAYQILVSAGIVIYIEVWGKAIYRKIQEWLHPDE